LLIYKSCDSGTFVILNTNCFIKLFWRNAKVWFWNLCSMKN
jgi:hypothetical protein